MFALPAGSRRSHLLTGARSVVGDAGRIARAGYDGIEPFAAAGRGTEGHDLGKGADVFGICDKPTIMHADGALSRSIGSGPEPDREEDEAVRMVGARADANDSEESLTYGRRLRRARLAKQWSQLQLAYRMREVGAEHRGTATLHSLLIMISKWENDRKHPNQYSLHLIAAALDVDVASLGLPVDQDFVF